MSDSDPAYRELEERQRLLLGSTSFRTPGFQGVDQIQSMLRDLYTDNCFEFSGGAGKVEQMKRALEAEFSKPFPTQYEAPEYYVLLVWQNLLIRNLLGRLDQNGTFASIPAPLLGTLPSPALNAYTIRTAGSPKSLIALNWGVCEVLINMTELALQTVKFDVNEDGTSMSIDNTEEEFKRRLRTMPELRDQLMHLLLFYYGSEKADPRSSSPARALYWLGSISRCMELFVLSHEYGHVLLNHNVAAGPPPDGSEILVRSWRQELEADMFGFDLMSDVLTEAASEVPRQKALLGYHMTAPLLYFECVRIVEQAQYVIQHSGELPPRPSFLEISEAEATLDLVLKDSSHRWDKPNVVAAFSRYTDHPPGWLRWELASKYLKQELPGLRERGQATLTGLGVAMGSNLHELWEQTLPDFVKLVQADESDEE